MLFNYPTIIADGFFKDPFEVRKMALELEYKTSPQGVYSGKRTPSLHLTHLNFFREVCGKILDCYSIPYTNYSASMHFHTTGAEFGDSGWVHADSTKGEGSVLACLVYLNPFSQSDITCGTSLYRLTNLNYGAETIPYMKESFISGVDNKNKKEEYNSNYIKTVDVGGNFNRMLAYDAKQYHTGSGYYGDDNNSSRLTLLTFFDSIQSESGYTVLDRADIRSYV